MKQLNPAAQTFPRISLSLFAVIYGLLWAVSWLVPDWGVRLGIIRCLSIVGVAALYGMSRLKFHPALNPAYLDWLRKSPWTTKDQLPFGPLHLIWSDYLTLGLLTSLTVFEYCLLPIPEDLMAETVVGYAYHWTAPVIAFMAFYLSGFSFVTLFTTNSIPYAALFAAPMVFCLAPSIDTLFVLILIVYAMNLALMKKSLTVLIHDGSLRVFPLDTSSVGWPTNVMFKKREPKFLTTPLKRHAFAVILPLVGTAYVYLLSRIINEPVQLAPCIGFGVLIAAIRALTYFLNGLPPISLFGRILNRRWIIPRYDKAFLAPLCALGLAIGVPYGLIALGVPMPWAGLACLFTSSWAVLGLPPSLREWHYCGHHRYVKTNIQATAQAQQRQQQAKDRSSTDYWTDWKTN